MFAYMRWVTNLPALPANIPFHAPFAILPLPLPTRQTASGVNSLSLFGIQIRRLPPARRCTSRAVRARDPSWQEQALAAAPSLGQKLDMTLQLESPGKESGEAFPSLGFAFQDINIREGDKTKYLLKAIFFWLCGVSEAAQPIPLGWEAQQHLAKPPT